MYLVQIEGLNPTRHRSAIAASKQFESMRRKSLRYPTVSYNGTELEYNHFAALCRSERAGKKDDALNRYERRTGIVI